MAADPTAESAVVAEVMAALASGAGQAHPYPHYARLRALGPTVTAPDGALLVVGHRACSALLRDHRLTKSPGLALAAAGYPDWVDRPSLRMMFGSILMLNPPAHTRLRSIVSGAFTARRVAALRPAVQRIVDDLCDQLAGDTDFVATMAFPLPVTVIGELLGIPTADRPQFQTLVRDWAMVLELLSPLAVDTADVAATQIADYLEHLAEERRMHPRDDLVSALVGNEGDDRLSGDELVTMLALLLAAGFETTTGLLTNGLLALLAHPAQASWLRAHPEAAAVAVEELLRYDSPVQMLFGRRATGQLDLPELSVTAGQRVITLLGAANRDPAVFDEPDALRLDRAGPAHVSFGGGIHYCLGAPLARLEASVAFPTLLRRFQRMELAGDPVHRQGLALHGHTALPLHASSAGSVGI
ncbi:MAG TPA: cytochrome P450 [Nocardioidaceae bacterium]|nr:cytochrome P450 [Nocardioidaceae bacterium]